MIFFLECLFVANGVLMGASLAQGNFTLFSLCCIIGTILCVAFASYN